jgi:hypothetical protein
MDALRQDLKHIGIVGPVAELFIGNVVVGTMTSRQVLFIARKLVSRLSQ